MSVTAAIQNSDLPQFECIARGKVRDIYSLDNEHLIIVTTDRLSAYDVVLPEPVPGKGEVLTQISYFWFDQLQHIVQNHLTDLTLADVLDDAQLAARYESRSMVVKRLKPLPIEAVVRGYLIGSGWRDYKSTGAVCGIELPAELKQASRLSEPLFTPATKAAVGDHDENISFAETCNILGTELASQVRDLSIAIYQHAVAHAEARGIIIADTKFEFGQDDDGKLYLIDEVLTPDSSRFWPASEYQEGISPPSFDKQFVRDYLDTLGWDQTPPGPVLPADIIERSAAKYQEAFTLLTGPKT